MGFKTALGWSAAFHLVLLFLRSPFHLVPSAEALHTLEVVILPPPVDVSRNVVPHPKAIPPEVPLAATTALPLPRPAQQRKIQPMSPPPAPKRVVAHPIAPAAAPKRVVAHPIAPAAAPKQEIKSPGEVFSIPAQAFVSLQHKQRVREHLEQRLRYPSDRLAAGAIGSPTTSPDTSGMVRLRLTLGPSGKLTGVQILFASDQHLASLAREGVEGASPYPAFPKELSAAQAQYEFLVQYRPE